MRRSDRRALKAKLLGIDAKGLAEHELDQKLRDGGKWPEWSAYMKKAAKPEPKPEKSSPNGVATVTSENANV